MLQSKSTSTYQIVYLLAEAASDPSERKAKKRKKSTSGQADIVKVSERPLNPTMFHFALNLEACETCAGCILHTQSAFWPFMVKNLFQNLIQKGGRLSSVFGSDERCGSLFLLCSQSRQSAYE